MSSAIDLAIVLLYLQQVIAVQKFACMSKVNWPVINKLNDTNEFHSVPSNCN